MYYSNMRKTSRTAQRSYVIADVTYELRLAQGQAEGGLVPNLRCMGCGETCVIGCG